MKKSYIYIIGAVVAIVALGVCGYFVKEKIAFNTEANKFVNNFPGEIPGAGKIEKFTAKDAQEVFVHIRQSHDRKGLGVGRAAHVDEVQKDIYSILVFLADSFGVNAVYREGETEDKSSQKRDDLLYKLVREGDGAEKVVSKINKEIEEIKEKGCQLEAELVVHKELKDHIGKQWSLDILKEIVENRKKIKDKETILGTILKTKNFELDAVNKLRREGKVTVRSTETEFSGNRATLIMEALQKVYKQEKREKELKNDPIFGQVIVEERENLALSIVAEKSELIKVVVFGGAHDFLGNIADWNSVKGNKKFSLIVITPASYELI